MMKDYEFIVFDLDGTITKDISSWNTAHVALGTEEKASKYLKQMEKQFAKGKKVSAYEWATHDIELWKGHNYDEVLKAVTPVTYFDNAIKSIRELHSKYNFELYIISGTFDAYMEAVIDDIGEGYIIDWNCHSIEVDDNNIIIGVDYDPAMVDKNIGIKDMAKFWEFDLNKTIAIGNGSNDIPMFKEAGLSIGFNAYSKKVREAVDISITSENFYDIVRYLRGYNE